ncbi:YlcI/YnfO family protein [Rhodoferax saidenbachensis]|uniref:Prevent-host-death protein n=1 Tax=Rhodoferax saidenbachensis TaxID=1484693 RepID=A0A1P8KFY9_9BURK|nr:YlcI/YnfO family protein [Rhodoferax saidenbachensis]APW44895.1 prevent-host-death protein [Rhodoferax saidenbachensis]
MKTATLPSVRVQPALREEVQALLGEHETLSEFVETAVRENVQRRRNQLEFAARGIASLESAKRTDSYVEADAVLDTLVRKLNVAKLKRAAGKR